MREEKTLETDYSKLGLKVGIEIHQQLATSTKLFCGCPPELFKEQPEITFLRRLRPTQSELGQVDPAAFFEFQKGIRIRYEANRSTSCLVEMDEEPPHPLNMEAVEVVLSAALMMNAKPVDEVHVMRKTVIDGSNTTGFQRTCAIALDGWIRVGGKMIPIQHASLEEDAARKTGDEETGKIIRYRIDRLGIPLIEVATGPVIYSPLEAQEVALTIGRILRDTGRVMRGLGTIRQDLNVSLPNGALVEIKGVQELDLISRAVELEVQRQLNLIQISHELKSREEALESLREEFVDVTNAFKKTKAKVIAKALEKKQVVLAVKLAGFAGFLKRELMPNFRLGTEMADRARFWGRVGGIFHTDEMPNYGVTIEEVEVLRKATNAGPEDAVIFVADNIENATDALKAVLDRAKEAISGVPAETRAANADGTTRYMRPRPGAARMYPETDIPPSLITTELLEKVRSSLPEPANKRRERLMKEYGLNEKLAMQIIDSDYNIVFEAIAKQTSVSATTIAAFLTETLKALKREGIAIEKVDDEQLKAIFQGVGSGMLAKEAVPEVFTWLSQHQEKTLQDALDGLSLKMLTKAEIESLVDRILADNRKTVERMGGKAFGLIMGLIMKEARGRADPAVVSKSLKEKLQ